MTLIFVAIPIGVLFGSSLVQYVKWAARGFADPAAYILFLAGFALLVRRNTKGPRATFAVAWGGGFLVALALLVRPNIAPLAGVLLAGSGIAALCQQKFARLSGLCVAFCRSSQRRCTIGSMGESWCCLPRPPPIPERWSCRLWLILPLWRSSSISTSAASMSVAPCGNSALGLRDRPSPTSWRR